MSDNKTASKRAISPDEKPKYIVPVCHEQVGIIFEDEHLLLVNKPAFLLSVPGRGPLNKDSVLSRLNEQYGEVFLLHRLDLDTSGIMVFAKTRLAQKHIARGFQKRAIHKRYVAVVNGIMNDKTGSINLPIAPDWDNRPRNKIDYDEGKEAITHWQVLEQDTAKQTTRLLLTPITGRSHQLRLHTKAIGHPILGCDLYAPPNVEAMSPRLLLHACELGFHHPITDKWTLYTSAVPF